MSLSARSLLRKIGLGRALGPLTRAGRRVRRWQRRQRALRSSAFNGVTVIIPTYRPNEYVHGAVRSALRQNMPRRMLDVVISVNGPDSKFAASLRRRYLLNRRVQVVYTESAGLSVARNYALPFVKHDLLTYLDDDDYLTRGYLAPMVIAMKPEWELVCGRVEDEVEGVREADTYLNRAIRRMPRLRRTRDYVRHASLLTIACGKVYRTEFVRDRYLPFDESTSHTEDVIFWAENIRNLTLPICAVPADGSQAYVRRMTAGSMSRPSQDRAYRFWVHGRLDVIKHLETLAFDPELTIPQRRFILLKLDAQWRHLTKHALTLTGQLRTQALEDVRAADLQLVRLGEISHNRGIAFCHNFAPFADASAYVAAKRLSELSRSTEGLINWSVITADMTGLRAKDLRFAEFYARRQYSGLRRVQGRTYFNVKAQHLWAEKAVEVAEEITDPASHVYSRSMFAGSHEAAYRYKKRHPEARWAAEFSDPIRIDTSGGPRPAGGVYEDEDAWLNDYWARTEDWVFELADEIIFTNHNQLAVMTESLEPSLRESVVKRSRVMRHPVLDTRWAGIAQTDYPIDSDFINIGYFGTFYADRRVDPLRELLSNPRVRLHLFMPNPDQSGIEPNEQIFVNRAVDHLSFLNLGSKLDYLVLNDLQYSGPINPYVPSKLADYLATGTRVLAFTYPGTILSETENPQVLRIAEGESALPLLAGDEVAERPTAEHTGVTAER